MPDFDIKKQLEDGLSFTKIIINVLTYSGSLFLGFYWSTLFNEAIATLLPDSHGIAQKAFIGLVVTVFFTIGFYGLIKYETYHMAKKSS